MGIETRRTCAAHGSQGVLVECEALVERVAPHGLVKDVTAREVEQGTEVLVVRDEPDINTPVQGTLLWYAANSLHRHSSICDRL